MQGQKAARKDWVGFQTFGIPKLVSGGTASEAMPWETSVDTLPWDAAIHKSSRSSKSSLGSLSPHAVLLGSCNRFTGLKEIKWLCQGTARHWAIAFPVNVYIMRKRATFRGSLPSADQYLCSDLGSQLPSEPYTHPSSSVSTDSCKGRKHSDSYLAHTKCRLRVFLSGLSYIVQGKPREYVGQGFLIL